MYRMGCTSEYLILPHIWSLTQKNLCYIIPTTHTHTITLSMHVCGQGLKQHWINVWKEWCKFCNNTCGSTIWQLDTITPRSGWLSSFRRCKRVTLTMLRQLCSTSSVGCSGIFSFSICTISTFSTTQHSWTSKQALWPSTRKSGISRQNWFVVSQNSGDWEIRDFFTENF